MFGRCKLNHYKEAGKEGTKMNRDERIEQVENFHDYNLHIPARTIYFGKEESEDSSDKDEVDSDSAGQMIRNLLILNGLSSELIIIYLNTTGGSWEDGMAIYDIIKSIASPVKIIGTGKIYSMGSVILQAAATRVVTKNSTVMIHDGTSGYVADSKSSEAWAVFSKDIRDSMYKIYYEKMVKVNSNITIKEIEELCSHDKIYNAQEAVACGLADMVI